LRQVADLLDVGLLDLAVDDLVFQLEIFDVWHLAPLDI
jgi:hypothetical protein